MTDEVIVSTAELLKVYAAAVDEALARIAELEKMLAVHRLAVDVDALKARIEELEAENAKLKEWNASLEAMVHNANDEVAKQVSRIKINRDGKARIAELESALKELADEYAPRAFYGEADDAVQKARALLAGKSVDNKRLSSLEALIDECIKIAKADEGCEISHIEGQMCEAGATIAAKIRAARAAYRGEKE